jgi:DNA repair exonuclease SbcCD ATPase subunit
VNGATQMRRLVIGKDPRLTDVSDADLHEQFRLAMQIRDETDRAHRSVLEIRSLREQLKQRAQAANDASLTERSSQIASKLDEVEQDLYQVRNRSPRDTLNYPIKLNNQLAVLQHEVDTGNNRPTDQNYAVLKELSARLDEILARLKIVLAGDLAAFNQGLAAKHVEPVKVPQP